MHFLSIHKAAIDLREGRLSEWDKAKYYLGTAIFGLLVSSAQTYLTISTNEGRAFGYLLALPVIYLAVAKLFHINSRHGGHDFITRLVILGFPATVRTFVGYWLISIGLGASITITSEVFLFWFSAIAIPIFYLAFFWQISLGLRAFNA